MTKAAVANPNRKSFGKNETPNKQKILNAVAKTPNSALKQIKTPKSGAKAQTNAAAYSPGIDFTGKLSRSQRRRLQKKRKKEQLKFQQGSASKPTSAKKGTNVKANGVNKEENEDEEDDIEDLEDEEDSEDGGEEEETEDDDAEIGVEEEGSDEEGTEEEDSDDDDDDDDDDEEDDEEVASPPTNNKRTAAQVEAESDDDDDDDDEEDTDEEKPAQKKQDKIKQEKTPAKEKQSATDKAVDIENCLYVGNLHFNTTAEEVEAHLNKSLSPGELKKVVFLPKYSGRNRGYCFVHFTSKSARDKILKLDGSQMNGRPLKIKPRNATGALDLIKKFIRIENVANSVNDGEIMQLLSSVVKLNSIRSFKRVRSNYLGVQGAVQLQFLTDDAYKNVQKLKDTALAGKQLSVVESAKPLKQARERSNQNQPKRQGGVKVGTHQNQKPKGERKFGNNQAINKRKQQKAGGGQSPKKIKKE